MAPKQLSAAAKEVLDFHRVVPNTEPRFADLLVGTTCIRSIDELQGAYFELAKAGLLEAEGHMGTVDGVRGLRAAERSIGCRARGKEVKAAALPADADSGSRGPRRLPSGHTPSRRGPAPLPPRAAWPSGS